MTVSQCSSSWVYNILDIPICFTLVTVHKRDSFSPSTINSSSILNDDDIRFCTKCTEYYLG